MKLAISINTNENSLSNKGEQQQSPPLSSTKMGNPFHSPHPEGQASHLTESVAQIQGDTATIIGQTALLLQEGSNPEHSEPSQPDDKKTTIQNNRANKLKRTHLPSSEDEALGKRAAKKGTHKSQGATADSVEATNLTNDHYWNGIHFLQNKKIIHTLEKKYAEEDIVTTNTLLKLIILDDFKLNRVACEPPYKLENPAHDIPHIFAFLLYIESDDLRETVNNWPITTYPPPPQQVIDILNTWLISCHVQQWQPKLTSLIEKVTGKKINEQNIKTKIGKRRRFLEKEKNKQQKQYTQ